MSPWVDLAPEPEERWHVWFAWYPVKVPYKPGYVAYTFLETVWRRRGPDGKWQYELSD